MASQGAALVETKVFDGTLWPSGQAVSRNGFHMGRLGHQTARTLPLGINEVAPRTKRLVSKPTYLPEAMPLCMVLAAAKGVLEE